MRAKPHRFCAVLLGTLIFAGTALAVDTWEPYPPGPATLEFYGLRYGEGSDADSLKGLALFGGPAWGLSSTTHIYLFTGISSSEEHRGGIDFLTLGIFRNLRDGKALDLDIYAQLDAFGEGLGLSTRLAGLEYNLDLNRWGIFARTAWRWENDGVDAAGKSVIGRRGLFTWGAYLSPSPAVQIMAEMIQEAPSGFQSFANDSRISNWAIGYNREVTPQVEAIFEARAHEAIGDGDRTWDFTVGAVTVW